MPCHENQECPKLPLRITYYHLSFPTNIQVPAVVFRMGPSSAVPGDSMQLAITGGNLLTAGLAKPGPSMSNMLDWLLHEVVEGRVENTREALLEKAREWQE